MRAASRTVAASAAVLALALAACAGSPMSDSPTPGSPSGSSRPPFITTSPLTPTGTPTQVPTARWTAIADDLAARGVTGPPELVSAEAMTFTDGSLGCAKPGQSYTQAIVEGMRVIVTVDGTRYDYRFGRGDSPKLCSP